jgi:hypothetical protein
MGVFLRKKFSSTEGLQKFLVEIAMKGRTGIISEN